jgi:hypothetical protein
LSPASLLFAWGETLLSLAVLLLILLVSAVVTNWFARTMYNRCTACGALNARRRERCRVCEKPIK